jgi:hypothetical protein
MPKPGKANYTILSFMLKTMEKLVDRYIRDKILRLRLLHRYQFAYQSGRSTDTVLCHVITHIEEAVENSEVTLEAFLDIEGAFDSTSFDIITKAAKQHGREDMICRWISSRLGSRKITATLAGETLEGFVARGCPQGGILSPLLWNLVVGKLIGGLDGNGYYTLGYVDDIAILIR